MKFFYGDISGILYDEVQFIHKLLTTYNCFLTQKTKNEEVIYNCKITNKISVENVCNMLSSMLSNDKYEYLETYTNINSFFNIIELMTEYGGTFPNTDSEEDLEIYFNLKFGQKILESFKKTSYEYISFSIEM